MVRRRGPRLAAAQKAELWRRWRQGESLNASGRVLGRIPKRVRYIVAGARAAYPGTPTARRPGPDAVRAGGNLPRRGPGPVPAADQSGPGARTVAGKSGSAAPAARPRRYRAAAADRRAWARGRRPKRWRMATHPALRDAVATQRALEWSPQQIAGWLRQAYPDDPTMRVSHETIYLSLFVQSRGVLKKALMTHLRQRRTYRRPKGAAAHPGGHIVDAVSLRERPATVEDRAVPGIGKAICSWARASPMSRPSWSGAPRYVCLVRVTGKETQTVVRALPRHVQRLPAGLMATLTWDRGLELAAHRTFSIATGVQVYFCDPQSPWQRDTNENHQRLAAPVSAEGDRPRRLHPGPAR